MSTAWKIQIASLVIALVAVVWVVINLNKRATIKPMTAASADAQAPKKKADAVDKKVKTIKVTHDEAKKSDDNHLAWCETRVKSLATKAGIKLEQEGTAWYSMLPQKKALNNVAMEKWLGKHCTLEIQDGRPPTFAPTNDVELLKVEFINGETQSFTLTPEGFYLYNGWRFHSKQLKEALDQLAKVANGEEFK